MNKTNFTIEEMDVIPLSKKSAIKLNWLMAKNDFKSGVRHLVNIVIFVLFCKKEGDD
jgi:hypothetical protein